jgi:hypothetical protein
VPSAMRTVPGSCWPWDGRILCKPSPPADLPVQQDTGAAISLDISEQLSHQHPCPPVVSHHWERKEHGSGTASLSYDWGETRFHNSLNKMLS